MPLQIFNSDQTAAISSVGFKNRIINGEMRIDQRNSGSSQTIIKAQLTKGAYTAAVIGRSKDFVEIEVTFNGQANTTDAAAASGYAPITWTVANAVSTAYC